ncbi:MAG: transcriptional regulator [Candidatus Cloacimonetes bacterium HGW-Cloacimonetes-3]|jgi:ArsR family transcriptional regulator|nr:MAG: transcriptional regulator [Candidatus Cloacimonetes bacterium HGW-Cloacimonetes-3]
MEDKVCLCKNIAAEEMQSIQAELPSALTISHMAEFFKVFGDGTRLKILYFLSRHELCVADIASLVEMQQSAVSHQLKLLRLNRLVKLRKDGTTVYYSLDDSHVESIFAMALLHLQEQ